MAKIYLGKGTFAFIDDQDLELIKGMKLYRVKHSKSNYLTYVVAYKGGKKIGQLHRIILGVKDKHVLVDHKDGDGLNNRRSNLRICTHAQNCQNRRPSKSGTSKYLGVSYCKVRNKWVSQITISGRTRSIGRFDNEIEAALAYNRAAALFHKDFCRLNDI